MDQSALFESQRETLCALAHIDPDRLEIREQVDECPSRPVPLVVGSVEIFLPSADLFDVDIERRRLRRRWPKSRGQIERLEGLLSGPFAERAPKDVVEKERVPPAGLPGDLTTNSEPSSTPSAERHSEARIGVR